MNSFTEDILERIKSNFKNDEKLVLKLINEAVLKYQHLNHPRIVRCILFLSKSISDIEKNIQIAVGDPRDIMLYAEYDNDNKRLRDFNNTFKENEL